MTQSTHRRQFTNSRILAAVDFSDCSWEAVNCAISLAESLKAQLDIVHCWELSPWLQPEVTINKDGQTISLGMAIEHDVRRQMDAWLKRLGATPVRWTSRIVEGPPAERLLEMAERDEVDVIVMGTHGRSGLANLLEGSVAQKIVRGAPCPVLTVRALKPQPPLPNSTKEQDIGR